MAITMTKYTHACVRLEQGDNALVIDPGVFSPEGELPQVLDGAGAVLITHEHADHVNPDELKKANVQVYAPFDIDGVDVTRTTAGTSFTAAGFQVRTYGGKHAVIHPLITMGYVDNVGYLIGDGDGSVYHPGDALVVPDEVVGTLLIPAHAPWSKTAELIDFAIGVRARHAHQVHDGLLNDRGTALVDRLLTQTTSGYGVDYARLGVGETVEV